MHSHVLRHHLTGDLRAHGGILSEEGLEALARSPAAVLFESVKPDAPESESLIFLDPHETIRARRTREVLPALVRAQMMLEQGKWLAGYVSYEASPAFLPAPEREPNDRPPFLLWFGVFPHPVRISRDPRHPVPLPAPRGFTIGEIDPGAREPDYHRSLRTIRRYLESGNSYQVNYTFPVTGRWTGTAAALYARLRATQPVPYGCLLIHDGLIALSFSPELFFDVRGGTITLRPMKGTAPRGRTAAEDDQLIRELTASEKERAENRMIVDLLRNDVGKIALPGSVSVRSFFDVETYESVFQATSTVTASLEPNCSLVDVMQALFPSGSVTGAPKIETMRIIDEVEETPRGIYTGALGFASPDGRMTFNVAIRTLLVDEKKGTFRFNVGSGVTVGSDPGREYLECLQKAQFVSREPVVFDLFETILWVPGKGLSHSADHLERMKSSALYFGRPFSRSRASAVLRETAERLEEEGGPLSRRVKLLCSASGFFDVQVAPLETLHEPVRVGVSKKRIDSRDRFQYHKTTHRARYDAAGEEARARGWFDAVLLNERGEVAEGTRSNIFVESDGVLYTPPVSAGILAGTARARILRTQSRPAVERPLTVKDLREADALFVSNALRGLVRAVLTR